MCVRVRVRACVCARVHARVCVRVCVCADQRSCVVSINLSTSAKFLHLHS